VEIPHHQCKVQGKHVEHLQMKERAAPWVACKLRETAGGGLLPPLCRKPFCRKLTHFASAPFEVSVRLLEDLRCAEGLGDWALDATNCARGLRLYACRRLSFRRRLRTGFRRRLRTGCTESRRLKLSSQASSAAWQSSPGLVTTMRLGMTSLESQSLSDPPRHGGSRGARKRRPWPPSVTAGHGGSQPPAAGEHGRTRRRLTAVCPSADSAAATIIASAAMSAAAAATASSTRLALGAAALAAAMAAASAALAAAGATVDAA
jgi:hypothetical protein